MKPKTIIMYALTTIAITTGTASILTTPNTPLQELLKTTSLLTASLTLATWLTQKTKLHEENEQK